MQYFKPICNRLRPGIFDAVVRLTEYNRIRTALDRRINFKFREILDDPLIFKEQFRSLLIMASDFKSGVEAGNNLSRIFSQSGDFERV